MCSLSESMPLVTFAVLTYNQRNYVLEAIKGALAQDYDNLEIIVSDDCSTDGTYELVESFVKSYTGPHRILVNQTLKNKCILGHFFDVVDLANGRLLLLAAGDDVSYPQRVSETVAAWRNEGAVGLYSNYDLIDHSGAILARDFSPNPSGPGVDNIFGKPLHYEIHGASSAYDLEFIRSLSRPAGRFFFEDSFMTFMIKLYDGKISKINKSLVGYRTHAASLSNSYLFKDTFSDVRNRERRAEVYSANRHDLLLFLIEYASSFIDPQSQKKVNIVELNYNLARLRIKSNWIKSSPNERIKCLFFHKHNTGFVRWIVPRLFGLKVFCVLRYISAFCRSKNIVQE